MFGFLKKLDLGIEKFCALALTVSVALMLSLTLMNIVMRWMGHSYLWVEPLVRHLVFSCAFFGGALATGRNRHIGIDILSKVFGSQRAIRFQHGVTNLTSSVIVILLTWASFKFMVQEFEFGKNEFLGIHSGFLVAVLPFGFTLMAFRSLFQVARAFRKEGS